MSLRLIISDTQGAFIKGRSTTDNILTSFEVLHFLKWKTQGKHGFEALKVDMAKAYDRVEWGILEEIMVRMGFHERWIQLIMVYISTVKFTILQDGMELGIVIPRMGLRQWDPLSPYLFIICVKALSSLIRAKESSWHIYGCRIDYIPLIFC